jgi:hypothetical protein
MSAQRLTAFKSTYFARKLYLQVSLVRPSEWKVIIILRTDIHTAEAAVDIDYIYSLKYTNNRLAAPRLRRLVAGLTAEARVQYHVSLRHVKFVVALG